MTGKRLDAILSAASILVWAIIFWHTIAKADDRTKSVACEQMAELVDIMEVRGTTVLERTEADGHKTWVVSNTLQSWSGLDNFFASYLERLGIKYRIRFNDPNESAIFPLEEVEIPDFETLHARHLQLGIDNGLRFEFVKRDDNEGQLRILRGGKIPVHYRVADPNAIILMSLPKTVASHYLSHIRHVVETLDKLEQRDAKAVAAADQVILSMSSHLHNNASRIETALKAGNLADDTSDGYYGKDTLGSIRDGLLSWMDTHRAYQNLIKVLEKPQDKKRVITLFDEQIKLYRDSDWVDHYYRHLIIENAKDRIIDGPDGYKMMSNL